MKSDTFKIYTKTGDQGSSGLIGGTRVSKDDIRLEAYGSVDELNSILGLLICELADRTDKAFLFTIQHRLFRIGSTLATDYTVKKAPFEESITDEMLKQMENEIDSIQDELPPLNHFILPGGNKAASICHIARTVCRRAERNTVKMAGVYNTDTSIIRYLNRLSDYLFALARKTCLFDSQEIYWDSSK
jgi:cob(I)alamin adenosyltransferase